ncbi:hypothetical protein, partial [Paraburkholderia sp. SIMBA_054]|uniref:hypothetical protein n=1 Tax=Paraburkholderia sp. SIMBA_054 TaxID=3085795 RepID=UPI00397C413A
MTRVRLVEPETTMALESAIVLLTAYFWACVGACTRALARAYSAHPSAHRPTHHAIESTIWFSVALGRMALLVSST